MINNDNILITFLQDDPKNWLPVERDQKYFLQRQEICHQTHWQEISGRQKLHMLLSFIFIESLKVYLQLTNSFLLNTVYMHVILYAWKFDFHICYLNFIAQNIQTGWPWFSCMACKAVSLTPCLCLWMRLNSCSFLAAESLYAALMISAIVSVLMKVFSSWRYFAGPFFKKTKKKA